MDKIKRIITQTKNEHERTDQLLKDIEFSIRGDEVMMFFNYDKTSQNTTVKSHHYAKHDHDPEYLNHEEMEEIKKELKKLDIPYYERRDDFL